MNGTASTGSAPPRLKLTLVTPTLQFGGAEQQVALLAATLDQTRFDVSVYCLHDRGPFAAELARAGIRVRGGWAPLAWPWRAYRAFKRWLLRDHAREGGVVVARPATAAETAATSGRLKSANDLAAEILYDLTAIGAWWSFVWHRPDIVHVFQTSAKMALVAARLAGTRATCYTEVCLTGDSLNPTQERILIWCLRRTRCVIAMSEAIRSHLVRGGLTAADIVLVPTMIDCRTASALAPRHDGTPRLGVVGRLVQGKGHSVLLEGMEMVCRSRPDASLLVAGDGPLRAALEAEVLQRGLAGKVRMMGEFGDIREVMGLIDVFVLPSLSEGMPVSILEAMAHGKAVIASRVGGIPDEVDDGETGLLVPPWDVAALAQAILDLLREPQRIARMGAAGKLRAEERFDARAVTRRVEELYRQARDEAH